MSWARAVFPPGVSIAVEHHRDATGVAYAVRIGRDDGTWKYAIAAYPAPSVGGSWSRPYDTEAEMRAALFHDLSEAP